MAEYPTIIGRGSWRINWIEAPLASNSVYFIDSNSVIYNYPANCVVIDNIGIKEPMDPDLIVDEGL